MAKDLRKQQETDAQRIPDTGTGKLDHQEPPAAREAGSQVEARKGASPHAGRGPRTEAPTGATTRKPVDEQTRQRLIRLRDELVERLRRLGIAPGADEPPRVAPESVVDIGDPVEESLNQDFAAVLRERLAERVTRLTAALERLEEGTYGLCVICGRPIEPERLAAIPETETCRQCQERLERLGASPERAA